MLVLTGAVFWVCGQNSADNSRVVVLLMSSAYTDSRLFCFSPHPPERRLGVHTELGGDIMGTDDPN